MLSRKGGRTESVLQTQTQTRVAALPSLVCQVNLPWDVPKKKCVLEIFTFSLESRPMKTFFPKFGWVGWRIPKKQGWAGKAFWLPGTGREIENHIPVLREGNGNSQIATGREGKGNLRLVIPGITGNGNSRSTLHEHQFFLGVFNIFL